MIHGIIIKTDLKNKTQNISYACNQACSWIANNTSAMTGKKITCKNCKRYFDI